MAKAPWINEFSTCVSEIVKQLNSEKKPVTPENISKLLEERSDLMPSLHTHQANKLKLVQEIEEENEKIRNLFKSIIASLSPFVKLPSKSQARFERLKDVISNPRAELDQIEKNLDHFKESIVEAELRETPKKEGIKKLFGFLNTQSQNIDLIELKDIMIQMLNALEPLVPLLNKLRWEEVKHCVEAIEDVKALPECNEALLAFLRELAENITKEKASLNDFIKELGSTLIEIEKSVLDSIAHVQASKEASIKITYHLDGQIEDLRQSTQQSLGIEDLRKVVLTKLAYIKDVIEKKKKQEEQYNKEIEKRMIKLQKELSHINEQIQETRKREEILKKEILKDVLTGIANRRAYEIRLMEEWERFKRYGHEFSIAIFDIDNFKNINDTYGHKAGDLILKEIARLMAKSIRKSDLLCRYGGEEFVIIFTGTKAEQAKEGAEKIRKLIENTKFVYKNQEIPVTVSAGVSQVEKSYHHPSEIFEKADKALYMAKTEGKNKVRLF